MKITNSCECVQDQHVQTKTKHRLVQEEKRDQSNLSPDKQQYFEMLFQFKITFLDFNVF